MPYGSRALSSRLVLKVKYHADGTYDKHKARLTVRGCFQVAGRDYDETYSPTAGTNSGRIMDALACLHSWRLWQADIANAFCQAFVDVPVYFDMPKGVKIFDDTGNTGGTQRRALRLVKALYGLCQSPRLFYKDLTSTLLKAGFISVIFDFEN